MFDLDKYKTIEKLQQEEEVEELTLSEVCKLLGKDIKIKK